MAKVNLTKATGDVLYWLAAMALHPKWFDDGLMKVFPDDLTLDSGGWFNPVESLFVLGDFGSTDVLDDEKISCMWRPELSSWWATFCADPADEDSFGVFGDTRLTAQLRCLVQKRLCNGDPDILDVEVPDAIYDMMLSERPADIFG